MIAASTLGIRLAQQLDRSLLSSIVLVIQQLPSPFHPRTLGTPMYSAIMTRSSLAS